MITQLRDPIHVITPRGKGWCHFLLDYGVNADVIWGTVLDNGGECWWCPNHLIRVSGNWSIGQKAGELETTRAPKTGDAGAAGGGPEGSA